MHPNPSFQQETRQRNIDFARERAFGTLAINGENGPETAHIPFLLNAQGDTVEFHLIRSNPIARADLPMPATLTILGPDSYISPDWYGVADQVPTWNYVAIRLRGALQPLPESKLSSVLDRLSAHFETRLSPKTPWTSAKMTASVRQKMMRSILPFSMKVTAIEGTWKLGQNKPDTARKDAADQLTASGIGQEIQTLAALMRGETK